VRLPVLIACLLTCPYLARAQEPARSIADLKKLSIEQLLNVQVTSVSRAEETLSGAPAALAVITNEDIRRSGATSVPEALRLVPGLHVARHTSSAWAIGARGFSSVNSEKLLVLSDTRSIYTPLFSGVFWDVQEFILQDIERIEVIRGPGATLWGSNAVNGVINITTKSARDTQGLFVQTTAGTEERATVAVRYGGRITDGGYYRVFGKYADRDGTLSRQTTNRDDWQIGHVGARADWERGTADTFTVQGNLYRADVGQLAPSVRVSGRSGPSGELRVTGAGGNVLARWRHRASPDSDFQVRAYYDRTHRNDPAFVDDLETVDLDVLHRSVARRRHELTWGATYRYMSNRNRGRGIFAVEPADSEDALVSGFLQDEIRLADSLRVTVGTKVEHNDFSGFEVQPSARAVWDMSSTRTIWGAISRAVRVPTRLERDISIDVGPAGPNAVLRLLGNPEFDSERLIAYEAGHRWQPMPSLFLDLSAFHNRYDGLASLELGQPFVDPADSRTIVPIINQNLNAGRGHGVEALMTLTPVPWWRVTASSAYLHMSVQPGGTDLNRGRFLAGATPRHQLGVRSYLDLPAAFQLDAMFRHLTDVERHPVVTSGAGFPGYAELDLRLAWRGARQLELSVLGQNLLHPSHVEFGDPDARGEIERGVYVRAAWGF
jgi:iron complex outermembrane receptor protein